MEDVLKIFNNKKILRTDNNLMKNTKYNSVKNDTGFKRYTDNQVYNIYSKNRIEENITIKKDTYTDSMSEEKRKEVERKINNAVERKINEAKDIPIVMKLMLKMMLEERGHNHREFRKAVCYILRNDCCEVKDILDHKNYSSEKIGKMAKWKEDKLKKLWARYLFDTYTMLCTKIVNNFIRYDNSFPPLFDDKEVDTPKKARMHVNKLGAIDVLNDKKKIKNILRDFSQGKEYLATRGNGLLGNSVPLLGTSVPLLWTSVPDKVEYGVLINQLNASIKGFATDLLEWCTNENKKSEYLKTIMEKMDKALSSILNGVDVELEKDKRSSTIRQPWNKACNLKKCVQFVYSKCKLGNNVITGQFFSGKNSRSGKKKYRNILNDCIVNLKFLKYQNKINVK